MDKELALVMRKKHQTHSSQSAKNEIRIPNWRKLAIGFRAMGVAGRRSMSCSLRNLTMRVSCVPYFLLVFRYLSLSALAWLRLSIRIFFPSIWAGFVYAESNILKCFIRLG
jgi:hypothetical protein